MIIVLNLSGPRKTAQSLFNDMLFEIKMHNLDEIIVTTPKYYPVIELIKMRKHLYYYIKGTYANFKITLR